MMNGEGTEAMESFAYSEMQHTPLHLQNLSLTQPTPEREANLEKYMLTRSHGAKRATPTSTAMQRLFRDDDVTTRRDMSEIRRKRDEKKVNSILMEEGVEGLMSEVQREREKYASLLEERRLLEETQIRMTERALSPGPPPLPGTDLHPQYRRYRTPSDMDLVSLEGDLVRQRERNNVIDVEDSWREQEEFVPINRSVQSHPPQMEEMVAQMWQYFQQQQQQQPPTPMTHIPQHTPVYNSLQPHHVPPLPTTPSQTQFSGYPTSIPSLPTAPFYHPNHCSHVPVTHPFPVYSHSLPPAPSPLPYYQTLPPVALGYPSPSPYPYYPSHLPNHIHQSLPTPSPAPGYSENQYLHNLPYPPFSNLNQSLPPSFTHPPTPAPPVPQAASCTQTDLTFIDNPISSPAPPQPRLSRRESRPAVGRRSAPMPATILSSPPVIESPLFDQVREQIYSEVASLVSENESRPYYLMELLRAAQLLNTDYLRQTGLSSLKRVINNYLNPDQIDPQAFSRFPAPPRPPLPGSILPETQLVQQEDQEEGVYSPTQNFPLVRHYLNTNLSGSSENVDERCISRACQLSEAVHQLRSQIDGHGDLGLSGGIIEDESDISEITTSDLSGCDIEPSPWEPRVRVLITRLIPILKQHLDERCEPRLLALIHHRILSLLLELFPEEVVQGVYRFLNKDLKVILGSYTSQKLRDCGEELLVDVSDLFFSQVNLLTTTDSLQLSYESDDSEYFEPDRRDEARNDELAFATLDSFQDQAERVPDMTLTLPEGHNFFPVVHSPKPSSPILSPPLVNIVDLTLSESRPLDENAVSEKSEDFSNSRTVDTVSETSSCTALDLSDIII